MLCSVLPRTGSFLNRTVHACGVGDADGTLVGVLLDGGVLGTLVGGTLGANRLFQLVDPFARDLPRVSL